MRPLELRGMRFGQRTVIGAAPGKHNSSYWYVRCSCGDVSAVSGQILRSGRGDRCSDCARSKRKQDELAAKKTAFIGKKFGSRTVTSIEGGMGRGVWANVTCRCGFESSVRLAYLAAGSANSCIACANATTRNTHRPFKRAGELA